MTALDPKLDSDTGDIFAGRIELLYALGRHYLSLPFAVLCLPIALIGAPGRPLLAILPLLLQIGVVIAGERLTTAYRLRARGSDARRWANHYVMASGIAGAAWGIGALVWFVPRDYPAEAFLAAAFLGMTASEFIARSAHRRAYVIHAVFSLTPLAGLLLLQASIYAALTALMIVLFAAVLANHCDRIARILDDSFRLRRENARLVDILRLEKRDAEAARDTAQASDRAKSAFIANISHELRTPLNALLGMTQLLDRAELDTPHHDHVKIMLEAGRGLETLLDDVITLTRADDDGDAQICDPATAVRTVVRLMQPRAWEKHLRLTISTAANLPSVAADPRRVRQILLKLVDNALKFTDRGGVDIRVDHDGLADGRPAARFSVIDSGRGVPADVAPTLYAPFAPGDTSYTRKQQGTGLGLSVVKHVVDAAGGATGFMSTPGEGAIFWVALPVTGATGECSAGEFAEVAAAPSGLTLLVFGHDEATRRELANLLEPFGNQFVIAEESAGAVACAGSDRLDMILVAADHAGILSAAPGRKAPVLALIAAGERAPLAADQILRWPASAAELYAAIASIRAPHGAPADAREAAALDAVAFAALEKSLGTRTLIEILKSYVESAGNLCDALMRASDDANWTEAERLAQDIAGSAGGLGLTSMTGVARRLAKATREGATPDELRGTAERILSEHERVRRSLANLYPDLVA